MSPCSGNIDIWKKLAKHRVGEGGTLQKAERWPGAKAALRWATACLGSPAHSQLNDTQRRNDTKAKLGMHLSTRKFGKKEWRNLICRILFTNERSWGLGFSSTRKSWGAICRFSDKNDFVFGNVKAWLPAPEKMQRNWKSKRVAYAIPLAPPTKIFGFHLQPPQSKRSLGCRNVSWSEC